MKRLISLMMCAVSLGAAAQIDWDFPYNPDGNNDGYIFSEDLLDLLVVYGQEFNSEALYLSEDSSRMIVQIGELLSKTKCLASCASLQGSWRVAHVNDAMYFFDFLVDGLVDYNASIGGIQDYDIEYMWLDRRSNNATTVRPEDLGMTMKNAQTNDFGDGFSQLEAAEFTQTVTQSNSSLPERNKSECWCVTQQRPRVEWQRIHEGEWEENKDQLSEDGWRLHSAEGNKIFFWRWAE